MRGSLEVADVFRDGQSEFLAQYGQQLLPEQRQVLHAVLRCRTAELGGHLQQCRDCGHQQIQYNSCRNRHCPKCQAMARAAWLEQRQRQLLPVPYFHIVFTLPHQLAPLALQNKRIVYGILFQAAARTLLQVAADTRHLGAQIGFFSVLHTWGQNLMHHPHLHCVVSGGGLSADGSRWIHCKNTKRRKLFFAPVKILSQVFQGKFIALLKQAFGSNQLKFHGQLKSLARPAAFQQLLQQATCRNWVVYAKRPFASPACLLKYLARYTHRVAISNRRLLQLQRGRVSLEYKDYADDNRTKVIPLRSSEFIRRFLMHTLPKGFVRIRYYGFLANRHRNQRLAQCRQLLGVTQAAADDHHAELPKQTSEHSPTPNTCPVCKRPALLVIGVVPPSQPPDTRQTLVQPPNVPKPMPPSRSPRAPPLHVPRLAS